MVPASKSPRSAFSLVPATLSRIHLIFAAEKYGDRVKPVDSLTSFRFSGVSKLLQISVALAHCQTRAL